MNDNNYIVCEYTNIKNIIELLPVMKERFNNYTCLKSNNKRAIYKVYDKKYNKIATAKFIIKHNIDTNQLNIFNFIKSNPHSNILNIYEIGVIGSFYVILAKYIDGITLCDYIKKYNNPSITKHLLTELINGLNFLHSKNILHSDIKPSNIIVTNENIPKIIDFDLSVVINDDFLFRNVIIGTRPYIPREILMEKKYSLKSDVWELGATFVKLLVEKEKLTNSNINNYFNNTNNTMCYLSYVDIDLDFLKPKFGLDFYNLINSMLIVDVNNRPSCYNLLKRLNNISSENI